jgi:glycosyltransferase involved in cell wall biosynthesis
MTATYVIIPAYNAGHFNGEAIALALDQTRPAQKACNSIGELHIIR